MTQHQVPTEVWQEIHRSADKMALEVIRRQEPTEDRAADVYIRAYEKVMDFLVIRYEVGKKE